MTEQDNGQKDNSIVEIMKFFSTPERPMGSGEFREFWESLSEDEKLEFKKADLSK